MNNDDGLLDFLTDDLVGRERDAVTRAFYGYATGEARADWITIGLLAGLILAALLSQLLGWAPLIS